VIILIKLGKKIDDDAFWVNGIVLQHFIDGSFNIFATEYDYRCWACDGYPEKNCEPISIQSLYELFKYLEVLKYE